MQTVILSAGFGGQGVMVLGQLLGLAACEDGREATFYPFYGPEQRGGTASCTTILADEQIGTPVADHCDVLVALNVPSLLKFQARVKPGGVIVTAPKIAASDEMRGDVQALPVDAEGVAAKVGSPKTANLVLLAVLARYFNLFSKTALETAVRDKLGKKKQMLELNLAALEAGWDYAETLTKR